MTDHPTSESAEQEPPRHDFVFIGEESDGCRTLAFHHITEAQRIAILKAVRRYGAYPLPLPLDEGMHALGEIGAGGPPHTVTAETAAAHARRVQTAFRAYKAYFGREPTQEQLATWEGTTLGLHSRSGLQEHLAKLRTHGYHWRKDFR